jgi:hypothetical protein
MVTEKITVLIHKQIFKSKTFVVVYFIGGLERVVLFCLYRPQTNLHIQSMYRTTKHYTPPPTDANSGSLMASKLKKNLRNIFIIKSYFGFYVLFIL